MEDLRHAFDMAKIACDSIKKDGNRTVIVYQSTMGESIGQKTFILRHFGEALEKHYIRVFFQPIVRTMTGCLSGRFCAGSGGSPADQPARPLCV